MPWPGRLEGGHELRVNKCTQPIVSGHRRSQVTEARLASEKSALGGAGYLESPPPLSRLLHSSSWCEVEGNWEGLGSGYRQIPGRLVAFSPVVPSCSSGLLAQLDSSVSLACLYW